MVFNRMRPFNDNNIGGSTKNREGLQRFLREKTNASLVEIDSIGRQLGLLPETVGLRPVYRSNSKLLAQSQQEWTQYIAHNEILIGQSHFDIITGVSDGHDSQMA